MKKFIFLLILLLFSVLLRAQIGINTDDPNPKAMLDIIAQDKGILIPRLTETERDALTKAPDETLLLTMAENSLMIYNTTEDCFNYWHQADLEWKSLCGSLGESLFTVDCPSVKAEGEYIIEKGLDGNNYLVLKVNVTKPGTWSVVAKSAPSNGYSFTGQGVFTEKGIQTIRIIGQGTPAVVQKDTFIISTTGSKDTCSTEIDVLTNISKYSLQCSTAVVNGNYVKGTALIGTNTIVLKVNVSEIGSYAISTELTNGIRFSASGNFTSTGAQQITLLGTGNPIVNNDFSIIIKANTVNGNSTCTALIPVMLPAMTYAVIGNTSSYSWGSTERLAALENGASFGPTGTVKIVRLTQAWQTVNVPQIINTLMGSGAQPDIILYNAYALPVSSSQMVDFSKAINHYVNQGGVLIYGASDGDGAEVNSFLKGIFGIETAQKQTAGNGTIHDNDYQINNLPDNSAINGPFGNLSSRYWGEDNASIGSIVLTSLPSNSIQIASAYNPFGKGEVNPEYSMIWYNDSKNFFYFGDSVGSNNTSNTSINDYPAIYDGNGIPKSKYYGNYPQPSGSPSQFVFNSALELNAVAWGLKKAAISGINPH